MPQRAPSAGGPRLLPGGRGESPEGVTELRNLPAGRDGAGTTATAPPPHQTRPQGFEAAPREAPRYLRPETPAPEGGRSPQRPHRRNVPRPDRERPGLRPTRKRRSEERRGGE